MKRLLLLVPLLLLLCSGDRPTNIAPVLGPPVAHMHEFGGTSYGIVSLSETVFVVVGPVTGWGPWASQTGEAAAGTPQVITSSWESGGITHTITTKVGGNYDLALGRHDKLLNKTLAYYPVDP